MPCENRRGQVELLIKKKGQGDGGKAASANQKLVSGTFVNLLNSFYACQLVNLQPARPL